MDSSKTLSIKRRLEITELPASTITFQKLKFDSSFIEMPSTQHCNIEFLIDENSCDSGFSESNSVKCHQEDDDELTFKSLDSLNDSHMSCASDLFENNHNQHHDSPFSLFNNITNTKTSNLYQKIEAQKDQRRLTPKSKSFSVNQTEIKMKLTESTSFDNNDERLVGDLSSPHTLPLIKRSKHNDLASITPSTLVDLMNGKYENEIGQFYIFDARYPYEYEGGHIEGAENGYFKDKILEKLFQAPLQCENGKRLVLIFHCEFSSERGPRLMREVRERDRLLNKDIYPHLNYPEMYLLEGGYKAFFELFNEKCEPRFYLPMLHENHRNDLKFFRKKSKTWELETRLTKKPPQTRNKLKF
jgi:hypothetical protein